ncbi:hypothetical protein QVD99_003862 [Batrachochytrium dendrobatidis]|nr:hypothetical protein QVD99_003862 [Batrachochytrium dendrobatidis]
MVYLHQYTIFQLLISRIRCHCNVSTHSTRLVSIVVVIKCRHYSCMYQLCVIDIDHHDMYSNATLSIYTVSFVINYNWYGLQSIVHGSVTFIAVVDLCSTML